MHVFLNKIIKSFYIFCLFGSAILMHQTYAAPWASFYRPNTKNRWTPQLVREQVGFDNKDISAAAVRESYAKSLCLFASALSAQDQVMVLAHEANGECAKIFAAEKELTDLIGPSEHSYFTPHSREGLIASLIYRDILTATDVLKVKSEEEIRESIARLCKSTEEDVCLLGNILDKKLAVALAKNKYTSLGDEIESGRQTILFWEYIWKESAVNTAFLKEEARKNIKARINILLTLITKSRRVECKGAYKKIVDNELFCQRQKLSDDAVSVYEKERINVQDLYAVIVVEISRLLRDSSLQKYAYKWDIREVFSREELLPGIYISSDVSMDIQKETAQDTVVSCVEKTTGVATVKEKKKRSKNKKKSGTHSITQTTLAQESTAHVPELVEVSEREKSPENESDELQGVSVSLQEEEIFAPEVSLSKDSFSVSPSVSRARHTNEQENPWIVTFQDAANNVAWRLYKVPGSQEREGLISRACAAFGRWARNISGWLSSNPEDEFVNEGYTDHASEKYQKVRRQYASDAQLHERVIVYHTFPKVIDGYMSEHGQATARLDSRTGRELTFVVAPGDVEFSNGARQPGLFSYITDNYTGTCFHRMFEPKDLNWRNAELYQVALSDEALTELMNLSSVQ